MLREMEMAHSGMKMQISEIYHIDAEDAYKEDQLKLRRFIKSLPQDSGFCLSFGSWSLRVSRKEVGWLNKLKICEMLATSFS